MNAIRLFALASFDSPPLGSQPRHSLFGVSAHFFLAMRSGRNGQPSWRARSRTLAFFSPKRSGDANDRCALRNESLSGVHRLRASIAWISDPSQRPKIIAPIVKTTALIQIKIAAFFSEMIGGGFMIHITAM
jgi:hypothetical protein